MTPRTRDAAHQAESRHRLFPRCYAWLCPAMERSGMAERRRHLLTGLSGSVIEIGVGSGASFAHYPPQIGRLVAVEPDPHLRRLAETEATRVPVSVDVITGQAEHLPIEDGSLDAAVAMLVLCSVTDPAAVMAELHRVVRPGGELRFIEHVRASSTGMCRVQRALDATVWPRLAGGCHTHRDTLATLEAGGFDLDHVDRFHFPKGPQVLPTSPHVAGVAIRRTRPTPIGG